MRGAATWTRPGETNGSVSAGQRIVLVGFMGAGKSTVGAGLARALGWDFVDLDEEIARRQRRSVDAIIHRSGIRRFREMESEVGRAVLARERVVVASGGGWASQPGHMSSLRGRAVSVWLKVGVDTALSRIEGSGQPRPLLGGPGSRETARELLGGRSAHYGRSDVVVDSEGRSPARIVEEIMGHPTVRALADMGS